MKFISTVICISTLVASGRKSFSPIECSAIKCGNLLCPPPAKIILKDDLCCPLCWNDELAYHRSVKGPSSDAPGPSLAAPMPGCNGVICPTLDVSCPDKNEQQMVPGACCMSCK
eukprot:GHVR01008526.1.p2 GENE.GHVR01008526.1~~GHVR01008526.1.p2  ORF type:complete len:114 (+),score=17.87 GHVR01008526.1:37-378(+)